MEISYDAFCNKYYNDARTAAEITIAKVRQTVKEDYDYEIAMDLGVSYGLEKAYKEYDPDNASHASVNTFLSRIVHNIIISELKKQKTVLNKMVKPTENQQRTMSTPYTSEIEGTDAIMLKKEDVIKQMLECIKKLPPTDQIIMKCWLEDEKHYAENAIRLLNWSDNQKNTVYVRFNRAKKVLAQLMGGKKPDYRDMYVNPAKWTCNTSD